MKYLKKYMKRIIALAAAAMIFTVSCPCLFAQFSLQPGDAMPDITLHGVKNYPTDDLRLSDLQGKLVILDFWTVFCHGCIQLMPEMEALQAQFKDRIQIILVTNSTRAQVERLKSRSAIVRDVKLPMVVGDSILTNLFVFRSVPTHVWINEKGIVNQFTGAYSNVQTVGDYLKGFPVKLTLKKEYRDFNPNVSLFDEGNGRQMKHVRYYSAIFEKIDDDGAFSHFSVDTIRQIYVRTYTNWPVLYLYQSAYALPGNLTPDLQNSRVILETRDSAQFILPPFEDAYRLQQWTKTNIYCYESYLPLSKRSQAQEVMRHELERYFGYKARIEKRKVRCWVLRCRDSSLLLQQRSQVLPQRVQVFFDQLKNKLAKEGKPVLNELYYTGKVNIHIESDPEDQIAFKKELTHYGLSLKSEERELDMLIISD